MKKCLLMLTGMAMSAGMLFAQPDNDKCAQATQLTIYGSEAEAVEVAGDTRGGTDAINDSIPVCSASFYRDDVWYAVTNEGAEPINVAIRLDYSGDGDDLVAVGFALYTSCDSDPVNESFWCGSTADDVVVICLQPGETVYARIWSAAGTAAQPELGAGTFRIAAFMPTDETDIVLWEETFTDGLAGWTTFGTCGGNPDSSHNAIWRYYANGVIDMGAYSNVGVGVHGSTVCDGAVGVDSDYDDNLGVAGNFGAGPCPAGDGSQYVLESPVIDHTMWDVPGITLTWTQGLREFDSEYFVGYRTHDNGVWGDWVSFEVNNEFPLNSAHFTRDVKRVFLSGAAADLNQPGGHEGDTRSAINGDSLQIRFVYDGNYYYWGIDDVKLVATEANNMQLDTDFPTYQLPIQGVVGQGIPWTPQIDLRNAGALAQTNVTLNARIEDEMGAVIYDESVNLGTIDGDSSVVNEDSEIPMPFDIAAEGVGTYTVTYTVTSDSASLDNDFNPADNVFTYEAFVDQNTFSVERGATRTIVGAAGNWDDLAPHSFIYGNYYHTPMGSWRTFESGTFGLANLDELEGADINFVLFEWTMGLEDETCQAGERQLIGFGTYTVGAGDGGADGDSVVTVPFENLVSAGPIVLKDNTSYILAVQWDSPADDIDLVVMAGDEYDYGQTIQQLGVLGTPHFAGMLAVPNDGINDGVDINTVTYNDGGSARSIVNVARMNTELFVAVKDPLPDNNLVTVYPNPVQDILTVDLEMERNFDRVELQVVNIEGKVVSEKVLYNIQKEKTTLDVSDLAAGTYLVGVRTEAGRRYLMVVVQ